MKSKVLAVAAILLLVVFLSKSLLAETISKKFPIATTQREEATLSAAFDGTNYLVGIQDGSGHSNPANITAQLVSQSGTLVGSRITIGRSGGVPFIAFGGTKYLMAWSDDALNTTSGFRIYGQIVSTTGSLVGPSFPIAPFPGANKREEPEGIAFGGGNYLVVYEKDVNTTNGIKRKVYGCIVSPSGSAGNEIAISSGFGTQGINNVAFDGTNFLIVWCDNNNPSEVKGRFISTSGVLGTEFTVGVSPRYNPLTVGFDGTNYLVIWDEEVGGKGSGIWRLRGQFVTTTGALTGQVISISAAKGAQVLPFIAFDGINYLITWTFGSKSPFGKSPDRKFNVFGRYISKSGTLVGSEFPLNNTGKGKTLLSPQDIIINEFGSPVVFSGGRGRCLAVWNTNVTMTQEGGFIFGDVYGEFIQE